MAQRVLGNVVPSGIKVLVLGVDIGIGSTLFSQFTAGYGEAIPTVDDPMAVVLAARRPIRSAQQCAGYWAIYGFEAAAGSVPRKNAWISSSVTFPSLSASMCLKMRACMSWTSASDRAPSPSASMIANMIRSMLP